MAAPDPIVSGFINEVNSTTRRHIVPTMADNVFRNDVLLMMFRTNNLNKFPGGVQISENFLYKSLGGGAYSPGDTFPVVRKQLQTQGTFQPKFYDVPITEFLEVIDVFNRGPEAVFRIIDVDMQVAALTMAARLAIALYQGGQNSRVLELNGLAEILSDGTNASWDGTTYANYGTIARNGTIGSALNSPMTSPASNVAGPISNKILEEGFNSLVIGPERPDVIITTNLGMSYISQKFQPQQRFETQDPKLGFVGLQYKTAKIYQSQYAPGQVAPEDATNLGYVTPASGETLFMLNSKGFRFWVADHPLFGFGFTGFKVAQDSTVVSGQYLFSGNVTCISPRYSRQFYGITG